jgi:hypothetical protein
MQLFNTLVVVQRCVTFVKASDATNNKGETEIMTRVSFQPLMKAIKMLMKKVEKYWMAFPSLSLIPSLTLFMSLN